MKYFLSFLFLTIFLASCGQNQADVETAKQELLNPGVTLNQNDVSGVETPDIAEQGTIVTNESDSYVEMRDITDTQYISVDTIKNQDTINGEVQITGKTLDEVKSISVRFSNEDSDFPVDNYTLQTFSPGDAVFKYNASSKSKVLDYGKNIYLITATASNGEVSQTEITINIPAQESQVAQETETQLVGGEDNLALVDLPKASSYGEPIMLSESSFTYSQIKSLEVQKEIVPELTCDDLNDFLQEKMNSWYYWNTCRDIVKDQGIRFNVIRLEGDEYIYERTYADFKNGFYGTYELERGTGVDSENIQEKNAELGEKEFPNTQIVDTLMRDILQS